MKEMMQQRKCTEHKQDTRIWLPRHATHVGYMVHPQAEHSHGFTRETETDGSEIEMVEAQGCIASMA